MENGTFDIRNYYSTTIDTQLKIFKNYTVSLFPIIFKNCLKEFCIYGTGGKTPFIKRPMNRAGVHYPINREGWQGKSSKGLSPEEVTIAFEKWWANQPDEQQAVSHLLDYLDPTSAISIFNEISNDSLLESELFSSTKVTKKTSGNLTAAMRQLKTFRNTASSSHMSNANLQKLTFDSYKKFLNCLLTAYSLLNTNALNSENKTCVETVKTLINEADKKPVSFGELSKKFERPVADISETLHLSVWSAGRIDFFRKIIYHAETKALASFLSRGQQEQAVFKEFKKKKTQTEKTPVYDFKSLKPIASNNTKLNVTQENELFGQCVTFFSEKSWTNEKTSEQIVNNFLPKINAQKNKLAVNQAMRIQLKNTILTFGTDSDEGRRLTHIFNAIKELGHSGRAVTIGSSKFNGDYRDEVLYFASLYKESKFVLIISISELKYYKDRISEAGIENILLCVLFGEQLMVPSVEMLKQFCNFQPDFAELNRAKEEIQPDFAERDLPESNKPVNDVELQRALASFQPVIAEIKEKEKEAEEAAITAHLSDLNLGDEISEGGEGKIYKTSLKGKVAKIYHDKNLDDTKYQKLKKMVKISKKDLSNVCLPEKLILDENDKFVGFLMKEVPSNYVTIEKGPFKLNQTEVADKEFPGWNRKSLVETCVAILRTFEKLHERNVLMGDINPNNILVDMNNPEHPSVYFVDCDSMQYEEYNSPAGLVYFTDPQIYKKYGETPKFEDIHRTLENEYYAIAVLLFEILFFGSPPYTSKSKQGIDIKRDMMAYNFPYRSELSTGADTKDTDRLLWSNTPSYLKKKFVTVFAEAKYITDNVWIGCFSGYAKDIKKGEFTDELNPRLYWDKPERTLNAYFTCENCGQEGNMPKERYEKIAENQGDPLLLCIPCKNAINSLNTMVPTALNDQAFSQMTEGGNRHVVCSKCGNQYITESYKDAYYYRYFRKKTTRICPTCQTPVTVICAKCRKKFNIPKWRKDSSKNNVYYCKDCHRKWLEGDKK